MDKENMMIEKMNIAMKTLLVSLKMYNNMQESKTQYRTKPDAKITKK